ncbi:MAG: hypothetical protein ACXVZ4_01945 [Gaiellaceae bacterium]
MKVVIAVGAVIAALVLAGGAAASTILSDTDVKSPTLKVNAQGIALVQYATKTGLRRNVLVWGAVNAVPNPTVAPTQQKFRIDYSGGWKSQHNAGYWKTFKNVCKPYTGPQLPFFTAGCTAPDGSNWALQTWDRNLPMRGFDPWTDQQKAMELHVSHWSGPLPQLEIYQHWTYANAWQGFFGRLMYDGQPVFGTRSPSATVADTWARNIYIDAYNSGYGPGWKHDTAITTHPGNGAFCYSFVPETPPKGYPSDKPLGLGLGERYRISVMGPGVTPIVQWEGPKLTRFDASAQAQATQAFDQILAGDAHCAPER